MLFELSLFGLGLGKETGKGLISHIRVRVRKGKDTGKGLSTCSIICMKSCMLGWAIWAYWDISAIWGANPTGGIRVRQECNKRSGGGRRLTENGFLTQHKDRSSSVKQG